MLLMLAALAVRLVVYPVNEYLAGDAVSRVELAERWAASPHLIRSFGDGAAQYGPLQLYLVGAALAWVDRNEAAKLINLVFGVVTIIPVFLVARRYFDDRAATWACLGLAAWGLHVQLSTTGGSEALALCLMWTVFACLASALERPRLLAFGAAALVMNLAMATRYDAWMYVPLLGVVPLVQWRDRAKAIGWGVAFVGLCLPFPVFWVAGNLAAHGDALYPFTYINEFHRTWAASETEAWSAIWLRLQGLGFWPAMALVTLTPGVAVLGAIGMAASVRTHPAARWLVIAAVVPSAYYALRTALFADFVPLARFTVLQVSLLLPFVVHGFVVTANRYGQAFAARAARASVVLALVFPVALGLYALFVPHKSADVVESVSPISTNDRAVMAAAVFVRENVAGGRRSIALDEDATYQDLQVGFYGRVRDDETMRMRWPGFRERFERAPADVVVLFDNGRLRREPWVQLTGDRLVIAGTAYKEVRGFTPPVRIFRR
jgi:4-amino-4-deoxy-L-arabinose transferase-like glycosyltransferase